MIDNDTIAKLVEQGGIVAPKGRPGSAIFFHGTLVHGSPPNMSPWDRQIIYVTYNSVHERHPPLQAARPISRTATSRRSMPGKTIAVRAPPSHKAAAE